MILQLIYSPDKLLKKTSKPVEKVTDEIRTFMDDMLETMHDRKGIGLAAVQVGVLKRIIVMDFSRKSERYPDMEEDESQPIYMANPKIIAQSEEENTYEEGCLSFPEQFANVVRPKIITVKYLDYNGDEQILECDDLLSTCVQHEVDHLNGITFVDHLSRVKRDMILKKLKKNQKFVENEKSPHETL